VNNKIELIGYSADLLFVLAYLLVSTKKLTGHGLIFNLMNLLGAITYGVYAVIKSAPPVLALEFFWGTIALVAIVRIYTTNRKLLIGLLILLAIIGFLLLRSM
jgi:hypothetical protein